MLREGRDGTIWVGTRKGLYRVETTGGGPALRAVDIGLAHQPLDQREIAGVTEDRFHTLWIAAPGALYRRWPDGSVARYTTRDGLPGKEFQNVYEDRAGHFWVATRDAGFVGFEADGSHTPADRSAARSPSPTACRTCGSINCSRRPTGDSGSPPDKDWRSSSRRATRAVAGFTPTPSGTASRTTTSTRSLKTATATSGSPRATRER